MNADSGTPRTDGLSKSAEVIAALSIDGLTTWAEEYLMLCRTLEREAAALRADRDALAVALRECVTETPGAACYNTGRKTRRLEAINDIAQQALAANGGQS